MPFSQSLTNPHRMKNTRLFMIDNYDSFTYNLARYFEELGHTMTIRRNDEVTVKDIEEAAPTHLIISPGPSNPSQAGITLAALNHFMNKIPILGVCLGHQAIAQALGGKVIHAPQIMHGKTSLIQHQQCGLFEEIPSPLEVMRYHSLIVDEASLPHDLKIIAKTFDSHHQEIMAIQHKTHPIYGVQFHPESVKTQYGHAILQNFLTNSIL
jgi:anthranilate synthase/aminodeoxychorismate synthase-like glutamine amidotransferase